MSYTHLTEEERYHIYGLKKAGFSLSAISQELGRSRSTISREIARNTGKRGYRPKQANQLAKERKSNNAKQISQTTWQKVEDKLREQWSPEQVSGRLKLASHESIYQHIYEDKRKGGDLYKYLRCQKARRKRYGSHSRRGCIANRVGIENRPKIVEKRSRIGDWEADTIIGKGHQQAIVSLVDRRSGFTLLAKVKNKTAEAVSQAIIGLLEPFASDALETITADNGREFAWHEKISDALDTSFFFANPYASWERGTNENTNGLVRQYFPKKQMFSEITDEQIQAVMEKLNHRPRKRLGFKTPYEVLSEFRGVALRA